MAIYLELEFGGTIIASVPIELTQQGHFAKALISAITSASQVGHIWLVPQTGVVGTGTASVNAEVDQALRIILRAETSEDLGAFEDYVQPRTAIVIWLTDTEGAGLLISQVELEVPYSGLFVSQTELEVPIPLRMLFSQMELEIPHSGLFVSQAELEVPHSGLFLSQAELEIPNV